MADSADRVSPLEAIALPIHPVDRVVGVSLSERICESLVQVQAWPDTVNSVEKTISTFSGDGTIIMPSGPGRWLIEDDSEDLEGRLRKKFKPSQAAVTGLTHGRVVVSVMGEKAAWILASGIAIDFDISAFPVGDTRLTHHHEIGLTIHRTGDNSFDLYVFTSLARSFWQWLERASAEVGYSVS